MKSKPTIVIDEQVPLLAELLHQQAQVQQLPAQHITNKNLQKAQALVARSVTPVSGKLLAQTGVQFVGSPTAGINHLDTQWLEQQNIRWAYAAGCNAQAVADYVLACIVNCQKQNLITDSKCRAGIIGAGHIGTQVASYLRQLGMTVLCYDPPRAEHDKTFRSAQFDELINLDLLCVHAALCNDTKHFINDKLIAKQNDNLVIINAARGDILDESTLLNYASVTFCLDVWPNEPNVKKDYVNSCFIATPHIAGYSIEAKERASLMIYDAICQHFNFENCAEKNPQNSSSFSILQLDNWQNQLLHCINPLQMTQHMKDAYNNGHINFKQYRQSLPWRHELAAIAHIARKQ